MDKAIGTDCDTLEPGRSVSQLDISSESFDIDSVSQVLFLF